MAIFDVFKSETRAVGGSDPALRAWARGDDIDIHRSNETSSGQKVDEDSALGLSTLYSCVAIRAEALASMPVHTYMTEGEKRVPTPSPIWMSRPNPEEDWAAYISAASWSLDMHGNLYEIVVRDRSNRVREMWMLDPADVDVSREMAGAPLTYRVKGQVFDGELRHRWLHRRPGDLIGSSPIAFARESIGLGLSAQQFGAEFFGAGGVPQGVATIPGNATTEQLREVKAQFTSRSRLPKVLQGGMTYQATSVAPNESQFLESRRFTAAEICAIFRVPPEFVAIGVEGSSLLYQNVSSSWLAFIRRALMAPMRILEASYSELLPAGSRFRFVPDVYLKPDTGARYDAYKVAVEGGWMTPNEVRRLEDQDDIEFGNTLYAVKKETAESVQTPEEAPVEDEEAAPQEGADVVPFGERADGPDEARHAQHNQKDHGRGSGKGGGDFKSGSYEGTSGSVTTSSGMDLRIDGEAFDTFSAYSDRGALVGILVVGERSENWAEVLGEGGVEVKRIQVEPRYRRKGVATAMHEHVKKLIPGLLHGANQTEDGAAWSATSPAEQRHAQHNQKDHGRGSGKGGGSAVPPAIGQSELPEGTVRGYHWTASDNMKSIEADGIQVDSSKGESYGENTVVWMAGKANLWGDPDYIEPGKILVEVAIPKDTYVVNGGFEETFSIATDVKPEQILAVHEAWHEGYRYLSKYRDKVLDGGFDDVADMEQYSKGISLIKAEGRSEQRHGSHNQKDHGRGNGVSGMARTLAEPDGGFTVDYGGTPIRTGWSVAQAGTTTPLKASEFVDNPRAAKKAIADKIRNAPEGMDGVGAWHEPETGIVHLDYVKVLPKGEKAAAIKMGKEQNQLSIASLDAIEAGDWDNAIVDTGGTGDDLRGKIPAYGTQTVGHVPATTEEEVERRGDRGDGREDLQRGVGQASELIALLGRINAREDRHGDHDQKTHGRKTAGAGGGAGRRLDPDALTGEGAYSVGSGAAGVKASGAIETASRLTKAERQAVADELNAQEYGRINGDLDASNQTIVEYGLHHQDLNAANQTVHFDEIPLGVRMQINAADAKITAMADEDVSGWSRQASEMGEAIDAYRGAYGAVGVNGTSVAGDIKVLSAEIENATGVTPASALISSVNRRWAQSSQSIVSEAMQLEVADARGESTFSMSVTGPSSILAPHGRQLSIDVPDSMGWLPSGSLLSASNLRNSIPTSIKSVRLATERQTAAVMKESGISPTDKVTLYRGANGGTITQSFPTDAAGLSSALSGGSGKRSTEITTNPLSSWSESRETAQNFGGVVIKVEVPARQIYGVSAWSGHGSLSEREVILYDDPGDFADYSVENRAKTKRINLDEFDADWIKQVGQGDTAYTADELRHADHDQKTHGRKSIAPVRGNKVSGETSHDLSMAAMADDPKIQAKVIGRMATSLGVTPEEAEAHLVEMAEASLAKGLPGKDWYEEANAEAADIAKRNGIDPEVGFAITAALSPGTPWDQNRANAEAMMEVFGKRDQEIDPAMVSKVNEWANKVSGTTGKPNSVNNIAEGETLNDILARDVELAGVYMAKSGGASVGYSYDNFTKATELMNRNDPAAIDSVLAGAKVRSFYNNISEPRGTEGHVTVDIHMQRAISSGTSVSGQDQYDRFQSIKKDASKITGTPKYDGASVGAMPVMADSIRNATATFNEAHGTNLLPQQFQAAVWVEQINQYPNSRTKNILKGKEIES